VWFNRLFELAEKKSSSVASMFSLGWEEGGKAWKWRKWLWMWEEELLVECRTLLHDVSLQTYLSNQWQLDPVRVYSVRNVYHLLTVFTDGISGRCSLAQPGAFESLNFCVEIAS
jgi:hypothetical protein